MSGLALKSPPSLKKYKADDAEEVDGVDSIDYEDPAMIAWLSKKGVTAALQHHFPLDDDILQLDYQEQVIQLTTKFKLADLRCVLQGLLTEGGTDWRNLRLTKLKSMKALGPVFAKACVELCNAKAELNTSSPIPADVTIDSDYYQKGKKSVMDFSDSDNRKNEKIKL